MKLLSKSAFAALLLLSASMQANAGVIITMTDDGADLTVTFSGSLDLTGTTGTLASNDDDWIRNESGQITRLWSIDSNRYHANAGTLSGANFGVFASLQNIPSNGTGTDFGYNYGFVYWDDSFGASPGVINVDRTFTRTGYTVPPTISATPTVLWTHNVTGDTISIVNGNVAVPEPSTFALLGLGAAGFCVRRRRRKTADQS